ncbi:MAG: hypothetical protein EU533_05460 [Promethearchaeota archaeon]|nr:MAG: hypothetical protein EU533_05460 [Candidatus Lokiarchaeota archaeon]
MSYEENNPSDIDQKWVFQILKNIIPDLETSEISFLYHGTYNVFKVKDEFIFRFPDKHFRNQKGQQMIVNEIKTLKMLKKHIKIKIPDPIFFSTRKDELYMGYKKIEGISLSRCVRMMSSSQKLEIAGSIGKILSQLHSRSLIHKIFPKTNFSFNAFKQDWRHKFEKIKAIAYPILSENQKDWVHKLYSCYLNNEDNFNFEPSIAHCDFDTSNIIVNPSNFRIEGIIDFEDTKIYDPSIDLLFLDEGEEFMKMIFKKYKIHKYDDLKERILFFYNQMGLEYLIFGIENDLEEMIKAGISLLIKRME